MHVLYPFPWLYIQTEWTMAGCCLKYFKLETGKNKWLSVLIFHLIYCLCVHLFCDWSHMEWSHATHSSDKILSETWHKTLPGRDNYLHEDEKINQQNAQINSGLIYY